MALPTEPVYNEKDFDWIQFKKDIGSVEMETKKEKLLRKIGENPMVPLGCLATLSALSYGLYSFRTGDRKMSQMMMRARIAAQGLTVVALVIGVGVSFSKRSSSS